MKYDIFVSYRRNSFETANLIAEKLRRLGYQVFFDVETLRNGKFNEQLLSVIEQCNDFIVVLPQGALDRCSCPDDWIRREVCHAMQHRKNIIPVMLTGFEWPNPMPEGMDELQYYQAITATSYEHFDLAIQKLKGYLQSKPHRQFRRYLVGIAAGIAALAACLIVFGIALRQIAKPICVNTANSMTVGMGNIDILGRINNEISDDWELFISQIRTVKSAKTADMLRSDLITSMKHYAGEIENLLQQQPAPQFDFSRSQEILLSFFDIASTDIQAFPMMYNLHFDELMATTQIITNVVESGDFSGMNLLNIENNIESFRYSIAMFYYAYMESLSSFPKYARTAYQQLSRQWSNLPNGIGLDLPKEEYERYQQVEMQKMEDLIQTQEASLAHATFGLEEIRNQLDSLNQVAGMFAKSGMSNGQEQADLELRKEIVETKRQTVEAKQRELDEAYAKMESLYETLRNQCQIEESDSQPYMWGKIIHWSKYMATVVKNRRKQQSEGVYLASSVTPERTLAEMNSLLACYQIYHPEAVAFIPSVKAFYKEVVSNGRPYAGVLVFGFKDNAEHPLYKAGDIVIRRNGIPVKNYQELTAAAQANDQNTTTFLRLVDGRFTEQTVSYPETDILVGYMELTEE